MWIKIALYKTLMPQLLYEVPLMLEAEGLADITCRKLNLENHTPDLSEWTAMVEREKRNRTENDPYCPRWKIC